MKKVIAILIFLCCCFSSLQAEPSTSEELKQTVCNLLPSMLGWCSKEKAFNFIDLVLEVKPEVCVEIGIFGGSSLFPVASALKFLDHGIVIGIDPWDNRECIKYFDPIEDAANLGWWEKVDLMRVYNSYLKMLKRYGLEKYCVTLRATSERAASQIDSIDILHLDGNYSEEVSLLDMKIYLPKVRSGGYIWINDALCLKRQQAVEFLLESCDVVKLIDNANCILFRKR